MDEVEEEEEEDGRPATPEGAPLAYYTALRLQVGPGSMARSVSPTRPCDPTLPVNGKLIVAAVTPWSSFSFFFFTSHPVAQLLFGHQPTRPVLNKGAPFFLSTIANNLKLN